MNPTVPIVMFGWIPLALALFYFLPPRRATLIGFLIAWMFLPIAAYPIQGLPDYTKLLAISAGLLLAIAIFDFRRLISLRFRWVDAPVLLFCLSPSASALRNDLGLHEGLAVIFVQVITWGIPYAIGRLYFDDLEGLRELAIGIVAGGLTYVPICLFEIWKGPELHRLVFGFYQPNLDSEPRFGILRPMAFMESGLMLAVWMAAATVLAFWLWRSRALPSLGRVSMAWLVPVLAVTTVLIRSVNGWCLLALGVGLFALLSMWRSAVPLLGLMALMVVYIAIRATGAWGDEYSTSAVSAVLPSKTASIAYRLWNENMLSANARKQALLGWGRQARAIEDGRGGYAVWDSMWIITFATFGVVGLLGFIGTMLLPVFAFIRRFPAVRWQEKALAPGVALAVILLLHMMDHLMNAMINPVFMLVAGGLAGLSSKPSARPSTEV